MRRDRSLIPHAVCALWLGIAGCGSRDNGKAVILPGAGANKADHSRAEASPPSADSVDEPLDGLGFPRRLGPPREFRLEDATSAENVTRFGKSDPITVENHATLLFSHGRYLDAPCRIRSEGLAIFANDVQIDAIQWPSSDFQAVEPPLPNQRDGWSGFDDLASGLRKKDIWLERTVKFIWSHDKSDIAMKKTIEVYQSLPFVESVKDSPLPDEDGDGLVAAPPWLIRTKSGDEYRIQIQPPSGKPLNRNKVLENIRRRIDAYVKTSQEGGFVCHYGRNTLRFEHGSNAWWGMTQMVEVLESGSSLYNKKRKLAILLREHLGYDKTLADAFLDDFVKTYRGSPQLHARVEAIRKEHSQLRGPKLIELPADEVEPPNAIQIEISRQKLAPLVEPRTQWKTALREAVRLLSEDKVEEYIDSFYHPVTLERSRTQHQRSTAAIAELVRDQPGSALAIHKRIAAQTPVFSEDGKRAFATVFLDKGGYTEFVFEKVGQYWYEIPW